MPVFAPVSLAICAFMPTTRPLASSSRCAFSRASASSFRRLSSRRALASSLVPNRDVGLALQGDSIAVAAKLFLIWGLALVARATSCYLIGNAALSRRLPPEG